MNQTTTSKKTRKKRGEIKKKRNQKKYNLPTTCLRCNRTLSDSVHHYFCNKCWHIIDLKLETYPEGSNWCFICQMRISNSPYAYFCKKHGDKIKTYGGKKLLKERI